MHDVLDVRALLPMVAAGGELPLRCPHARPAIDEGVPSVSCGVIEAANRREPMAAEVPSLVSGKRSGSTIAFFCAGQGIPGVELTDEKVAEIRASGGLDAEEAHRTFCYTACQVFRDDFEHAERVRRDGHQARFEAAGVTRVEH